MQPNGNTILWTMTLKQCFVKYKWHNTPGFCCVSFRLHYFRPGIGGALCSTGAPLCSTGAPLCSTVPPLCSPRARGSTAQGPALLWGVAGLTSAIQPPSPPPRCPPPWGTRRHCPPPPRGPACRPSAPPPAASSRCTPAPPVSCTQQTRRR